MKAKTIEYIAGACGVLSFVLVFILVGLFGYTFWVSFPSPFKEYFVLIYAFILGGGSIFIMSQYFKC